MRSEGLVIWRVQTSSTNLLTAYESIIIRSSSVSVLFIEQLKAHIPQLSPLPLPSPLPHPLVISHEKGVLHLASVLEISQHYSNIHSYMSIPHQCCTVHLEMFIEMLMDSFPDPLATCDLEDKGMYVLKKKDDDAFLFGGISRSKPNKRSKRDKRKSFVSIILCYCFVQCQSSTLDPMCIHFALEDWADAVAISSHFTRSYVSHCYLLSPLIIGVSKFLLVFKVLALLNIDCHSIIFMFTLQNKPIVHTPEIFAQFASLSLNAPSSMSEVPVSIDQLKDKKVFHSLSISFSPDK